MIFRHWLVTMALAVGCSHPTPGQATDAGPGADAPLDGPDVAARQAAADQTAASAAECAAIGDFYWEIGDASGRLGSGARGTTYGATTAVSIASSSKIVFGAYMIESKAGALTDVQKAALRMLSGYAGLDPLLCSKAATVQACLDAGTPGPNYRYAAAEVGKFHYNGAHDQWYVATSTAQGGEGMAALSAAQLTSTVLTTLKISPGFAYASPLPSGGIRSTPEQFAVFLRAIVSGQLRLHDYLGADAVCTLPGPDCPAAVSSPSPYAWHYSYNHWVEDDPTGDGAFSSAGAFGFYPWVSKDKTLYGLLSRQSTAGAGGFDSVNCGKKLRAAWITARPQ